MTDPLREAIRSAMSSEDGPKKAQALTHVLAALSAVRSAMIATQAGAPVLPSLLTAEERLLRVLFDEDTVAEYLASPGAKIYGR